MSINVNAVVLGGRVATEPKFSDTRIGTVARLRLAVNSYRDGEEKVNFFSVAVFGKQADAVRRFVGKGDSIVVEGALSQNEWTTEQGEKRSDVSLNAFRAHFAGKADSQPAKPAQPQQSADDNVPF